MSDNLTLDLLWRSDMEFVTLIESSNDKYFVIYEFRTISGVIIELECVIQCTLVVKRYWPPSEK